MIVLSRYPTYTVFLSVVISMVAAALLFPFWIRLLRVRNIGQQVRADGPQGHLVKQGTPTMGGVLILLVVAATFAVMGHPTPLSLLALGTMLACGTLGFIDDWSKVSHERSLGLRPSAKLFWQGVISIAFGLLVVNWAQLPTWVQIPLTTYKIDMGEISSTFYVAGVTVVVPWLYLALVYIMVTGMSNAVNLTDGLDGLAAGTVMIVTLAFAAIVQGCIVLEVKSGTIPIPAAAIRCGKWLGDRSYSLYLTHFTVLASFGVVAAKLLGTADKDSLGGTAVWGIVTFIGLIAILPIASLTYRIIEKPSHLLAKRFGADRSRSSPKAT